jgi:hypothetical protein
MFKMSIKFLQTLLAGFGIIAQGGTVNSEKLEAMPVIRQNLARQIQKKQPKKYAGTAKVTKWSNKLNSNGLFSDIVITRSEAKSRSWKTQGDVIKKLQKVFPRLRDIAWSLNNKSISQQGLKRKLYKSISNYCTLEISRPDMRRFLDSCFTFPRCAAEIYFSLYDDMQKVRNGQLKSPEAVKAEKMLRKVAFQAFTQPKREDVNDPYSVNQFRNHVWWVGGNFAYRSPFLCAAACNDARMLDTVWQVCNDAISPVSFNTLNTAFWNECFNADGAAWGHGPQSYAFGYGIDGANGIIRNMKEFKGTPWFKKGLSDEKFSKLLNFAKGMAWLQYRMRACLTVNGRHNLTAGKNNSGARISGYLWELSFLNPSPAIKAKMDKFNKSIDKNKSIALKGTRYFWNNDDLVMRGKDYYALVNMISSRSRGPESVIGSSQTNYNLADGSTVLLRTGDEYDYAKGAWNFATIPGTTNRNVKKLPAETIWRGFASKFNFAGGIGGDTGCAGFIFEKAPFYNPDDKFKKLYGVKAYKSYFMLDGIMVALGTGIKNKKSELEGNIITNLNQTALRSPVVYGTALAQKGSGKVPFELKYDMKKIGQPVLAVQDGIGYIILPKYTASKVVISAQKRRTSWKQIDQRNKGKKDLPETVDVFSMSIDHGRCPDGKNAASKYGYIVMMNNASAENVVKLLKSKRIKVVANNTAIQAIWDKKLKIAQMIIYKAGTTYKYGSLQVKSNVPAVVQIRQLAKDKMEIKVSDPTQNPNLKEIKLDIDGRVINVPIPGKPYCGKSTTVSI